MTIISGHYTLAGTIATLTASPSPPIAFSPITATWPGCKSAPEAQLAADVLVLAIATAMLDATKLSVPTTASTSGGFIGTPTVTVQGLGPLSGVIIALPSAFNVLDARREARKALFRTAHDTSLHYDASLSSFTKQNPASNWPAWAVALYQHWTS